jgi:protein-S-isoprenylcysteine O-methyltransferase Ste14
MISGLSLSFAILTIVIIFFVVDYFYMNRHDRERESGKGWSWDYTLFSMALSLLIILQPWLLPWLGWTTTNLWGLGLQAVGGILVFISFGLHIWSRNHLKRFYSERVEIQQGHQVINTGPYAMVRHPIFTSFFALAVGLVFFNPSITTLVVMLYTFWDFSRAAKQEEELLSNTLPEYRIYMKKTSRFLPRFWKNL